METTQSVFSIGEAFKFGWETTKKHLWLFAGAMLVLAFLSGISSSITSGFDHPGAHLLKFFAQVLFWVIGSFIHLMVYKAILMFVDGQGQPKTVQELFPTQSTFFTYLGASVLFFIGLGVGTILLIVPGILFALAFGLYGLVITEEMNIGPVAALKHSLALTKGHWWDLFLMGLCMIGVVVLGALALGVGLLVAVPVCMLASGYVYRKLSLHASSLGIRVPVEMVRQ